jgi:hypothetical protein
MPNVSGYATKRKPHRVRPHFRYPSRTKLQLELTAAQTRYYKAFSNAERVGSEAAGRRLEKAQKKLDLAERRLREFYP